MSKTSLSTAKAHLRVTASDEDSLIGLYVDAAEEHAEKWCDREFGTPLPYSVTAAVLLIVGGLYENRESLVPTQLNANPAVEVAAAVPQLCRFLRQCDHAAGVRLVGQQPNQHRRRLVSRVALENRTDGD